jgi:hypothetical protein
VLCFPGIFRRALDAGLGNMWEEVRSPGRNSVTGPDGLASRLDNAGVSVHVRSEEQAGTFAYRARENDCVFGVAPNPTLAHRRLSLASELRRTDSVLEDLHNDKGVWGFDVSRCVTVPLYAGVGAWRVH